MQRLLKTSRLIGRAKRTVRKIHKAYQRLVGSRRLRNAGKSSSVRIVIGAGTKLEPGWLPTQMEFLNLLKPADWERFFHPGSIEAMMAEHVWEHLTEDEARAAARLCFTYLKPGGYLRVAVPDGLHPDPSYLGWVKVGGASPMQTANGHKVLYTYTTLRELFEKSGFRVRLYEYFDEAGAFHYNDWDEKAGKIWRSKRFDKRNQDGRLAFTSIILDAVKA